MSQAEPVFASVHPFLRSVLSGLGGAALAGSLLLTSGCTAPGMKFAEKSSSAPTTLNISGLRVTLHRLDTEAAKLPVPAAFKPADFTDLFITPGAPYLIGPQDVLLVTVWDHPEITLALGQYRTDNTTGSLVEEDGMLYFPYVGRIRVAGLSATQARALLTEKLARTLQNPQVDVKVLAYRSQKIYVGGEVKAPATYTVTDVPFTLSEAINRAGGFTPTGDDSRVQLTRGNNSWILNFQALMSQGGWANKILLKDGDVVQVPNSLESPVYMMGELMKPGTLPLPHGVLSLAKAISDAGGIQFNSADARSIYVIRQGQGGNAVDVFHLDGRNPATMVLADRFALRPRDFVYVDAGTTVRFSRVMNLLLPSIEANLSSAEAYYLVRSVKP